jgi:hypothetical protein
MEAISTAASTSPAMCWTGRVLSTLAVLFLIFDGAVKLIPLSVVTESMVQLGYPGSVGLARGLGILTLVCVTLYVYPRTSVLGAILLTGLFGGGMASHLRVGDPIFSHFLFGGYLGLMIWGGLYLRDEGLRSLMPWRRTDANP